MYNTDKRTFNFTKKYLMNWFNLRRSLNPQPKWDETLETLRSNPFPPLDKRDGKAIVAGPFKGYYSCKIGVKSDRVIYYVKEDVIYFIFIGSHNEYEKFIK